MQAATRPVHGTGLIATVAVCQLCTVNRIEAMRAFAFLPMLSNQLKRLLAVLCRAVLAF